MERWKYLVVKLKPGFFGEVASEKLQAELDKHGAAGWELVSAVPQPMRGTQLIFKRT